MMGDELSDAAKSEIAAAVAQVREDRFEMFARGMLEKKPETPTVEEVQGSVNGDVKTGKEEVKVEGKTPPDKGPVEDKPKKIGLWGNYAE